MPLFWGTPETASPDLVLMSTPKRPATGMVRTKARMVGSNLRMIILVILVQAEAWLESLDDESTHFGS